MALHKSQAPGPLRPLRGLQESRVATREESGVLGFPSRRGLTPGGLGASRVVLVVTLPFPIPAGAQGPAGLQSARSRAGPADQISVFCPLDFQRTLGCLDGAGTLGVPLGGTRHVGPRSSPRGPTSSQHRNRGPGTIGALPTLKSTSLSLGISTLPAAAVSPFPPPCQPLSVPTLTILLPLTALSVPPPPSRSLHRGHPGGADGAPHRGPGEVC